MKKQPVFLLSLFWICISLWTPPAAWSQRFELGSVNFAGFDLVANAVQMNLPCALLNGMDKDTLGVSLQPDGSYLIFRKAIAGDVGGFGCAQNAETALLLRVKGAGTKEVSIEWQTISRAQFDWTDSCPCPPEVEAQGQGTTELALSLNLVNLPPGSPAVIRYNWTQLCTIASPSEGAGEDSAFVLNRLRLANTTLYQDSTGTTTSKWRQIGQKDQTGQIIASNGDSILLEVFSRVFARIDDPPIWSAFPEDDAVAESYGTLNLAITGSVSAAGDAGATNLEPPVLAPNPARDRSSIRWRQDYAGAAAFFLTDPSGRIVTVFQSGEQSTGNRQFDLNLEGLPAGIYILSGELKTAQGFLRFPPQRLAVVSR